MIMLPSTFYCSRHAHIKCCVQSHVIASRRMAKFGFDDSRFDESMFVMYGHEAKNPGIVEPATNLEQKLMARDLSKNRKEGNLPHYLTVEKANRYVHKTPKSGSSTGSTATGLPICHLTAGTIASSLRAEALPFWIAPDKQQLEAQPEHWDVETVSVLSKCESVRDLNTRLASPSSHPECALLWVQWDSRQYNSTKTPLSHSRTGINTRSYQGRTVESRRVQSLRMVRNAPSMYPCQAAAGGWDERCAYQLQRSRV